MKEQIYKKLWELFLVVFASLLFTLGFGYINSKQKINTVNLYTKDGEKGICADVYAEALNWGIQQFKFNWKTEHWNYPSYWIEETKAMAWYKYWKENIMKE